MLTSAWHIINCTEGLIRVQLPNRVTSCYTDRSKLCLNNILIHWVKQLQLLQLYEELTATSNQPPGGDARKKEVLHGSVGLSVLRDDDDANIFVHNFILLVSRGRDAPWYHFILGLYHYQVTWWIAHRQFMATTTFRSWLKGGARAQKVLTPKCRVKLQTSL